MQLGIPVTIGFYLVETALLLAIVGVGAFVYRQERRMTWEVRLERAQRPWEARQSPLLVYCLGGWFILLAAGFFAVFLLGTFQPFLGLGMGFAVLGASQLFRGLRLARRRRANTAVAAPRE